MSPAAFFNILYKAVSSSILDLKPSCHDLLSEKSKSLVPIAFSPKPNLDYSYLTEKSDCTCQKTKFLWASFIDFSGDNLKYAPCEIKLDYFITLSAVSSNGMALAYAAYDYKQNPKIVTAAILNNGLSIQYASEALKASKLLGTLAVRQNTEAIRFLSKSLQEDSDIIKLTIR